MCFNTVSEYGVWGMGYDSMWLCLQLPVLRKGLDVHGKRITPLLKGMQLNLEEKLDEMVLEVFPERRKKVKCVMAIHYVHFSWLSAACEISNCQKCSSSSNPPK